MRTALESRLKEAIGGWSIKPVHASMFGSAARGDGDLTSDIDLLVIRPRAVKEGDIAWEHQIFLLERDVALWTGNRASVAEVPEAETSAVRM
jgi:predicted nucleotidyltransferase